VNDLATSCKNLVNFSPVTPELKRGKDVHPSSFNQQFGDVRLAAPLLDLAKISTEFCWAISTQICFSYSLRSTIAIHAGLCHAFIVLSYFFCKLYLVLSFIFCLPHDHLCNLFNLCLIMYVFLLPHLWWNKVVCACDGE